jgi:micrococcal nuclease
MNSTTIKNETNDIDWDSVDSKVKELSFKGEEKLAKCVSVYDGDTVRVVFPIHKTLYKWNCRLNRIDTPELKTNNVLEQSFGYEVRDKIREKILNKMVIVKCDNFDKYGRLLAEIYIDGVSINQWMIDNKYAFEYDGGTKKKWEPYLQEIGYIAVEKKVDPKPEKVKKPKKEKENLEENINNGDVKENGNSENSEDSEELIGKKKGRADAAKGKKEKVEKTVSENEKIKKEKNEKKTQKKNEVKVNDKKKPEAKKNNKKKPKRGSDDDFDDSDFSVTEEDLSDDSYENSDS